MSHIGSIFSVWNKKLALSRSLTFTNLIKKLISVTFIHTKDRHLAVIVHLKTTM